MDDAGFMEMAGMLAPKPSAGLIVRFYMEAVDDDKATREAGRLVCRDEEYVEIRIPGDLDVQRHPVTDVDKQRFPEHYAAFKKSQPQETVTGTPLTKWPGSPPASRIREAAALDIHTVEQLAEVSDANLMRLGPGWREIRQKARDYIVAAKDTAVLFKLRAENDELRQRLSSLEDMARKQAAEIDRARNNGGTLPPAPAPAVDIAAIVQAQVAAALAAAAPAPKRRGRPPKAKPTDPAGSAE